MWGNVTGWIISVLLVVGTIGLVELVKELERPTPPTAFSARVIGAGVLQPPIPARNLLPDLSGPPDATAAVSKAIESYRADRWTYERAARGDVPDNFDSLPAVTAILDAAMAKSDALLLPLAKDVVTFRSTKPELETMSVLGEGLVRAAMVREKTDPDTAAGYYNAALALGAKMCRERLVYQELQSGLNLMIEASQRLSKLTRNNRRTDALVKFESTEREFYEQRITPVWQVLGSVDPGVVATHAGDVILIARQCPERLWRVEAIFALGRQQFSGPRVTDAATARRELKKIAEEQETDPIVHQAAEAASSMSIDEFRMLR